MYLCTLQTAAVMKGLKPYTIQYVGLKEGAHTFEYTITKSFFDLFEYDDFNESNVRASLLLTKKSTLMEFDFEVKGMINVDCDVSNEPYDQPIEDRYELVVKFGQERNDELEGILILPFGEFEVNIAQYIYELIVLALPNKRVHPGIADGSLQSDILDKLEELSIPDQSDNEEKEETDPRWDSLKKLLTDK